VVLKLVSDGIGGFKQGICGGSSKALVGLKLVSDEH